MNKFGPGLVVILGLVGVGMSPAALAVDNPTPVSAGATIDWSQLQLSVTGVTATVPTVVFSNYRTSLDSSSSAADGSESSSATRNNWTSSVQTEADAGASLANGFASSTIFSGTANAVGMESVANASGNRTVEFFFDGPGVLTVSVPYTLSLTGLSCCNFDSASVSGNASFNSFTGDGSSNSNSGVSFSLNSYSGSSSTSQAGNLVFGIVASDAGSGSLSVGFNLATNGVGVVPEPESYAMLLAGLGLMGAVVKRRNRSGRT
jgi:PEP-CTERM motif